MIKSIPKFNTKSAKNASNTAQIYLHALLIPTSITSEFSVVKYRTTDKKEVIITITSFFIVMNRTVLYVLFFAIILTLFQLEFLHMRQVQLLSVGKLRGSSVTKSVNESQRRLDFRAAHVRIT